MNDEITTGKEIRGGGGELQKIQKLMHMFTLKTS